MLPVGRDPRADVKFFYHHVRVLDDAVARALASRHNWPDGVLRFLLAMLQYGSHPRTPT